MPREKMPVWEYTPTNGYNFVQKYNSISDVQKKYYDGKYPMFRYHPKIHILPNGNILLNQTLCSLTETWLNKQLRIMNDPLCIDRKVKHDSVELLNENGDVIAWFANATIIDKIKSKTCTQYAQVALSKGKIPNINVTGIYYKKSNKTFTNGND